MPYTNSEIFAKAGEVHSQAYEYLDVIKKSVGKSGDFKFVVYRCRLHGLIQQRMDGHLKGQGCSECAYARLGVEQAMTFEDFKARAEKILPGTVFTKLIKPRAKPAKFEALCPKGHTYQQLACNFLSSRSGCNVCTVTKHTLESVKIKAEQLYGTLYTYLDLKLNAKGRAEVAYSCPSHGDITQNLSVHFRGKGCPKCARQRAGQKTSMSLGEFKEKFAKESALSLVESTYVNAVTHAEFICPNGHTTKKRPAHLKNNPSCLLCSSRISSQNKEIHAFVLGQGVAAELEKKVHGFSIDTYSASKNLAIDFHGLIWHSSRFLSVENLRKDYQRKLSLDKLGVKNIQLFADEWFYRRAQCELYLKHILGTLPKLNTRDCTVKSIQREEANTWFEATHIQGAPRSLKVAIGLYRGQELVAVGAFSDSLSTRGRCIRSGDWELVRFSSNYSVRGAFGKIFSAFLKQEPQASSVITFSDNRLFSGKMYAQNGFKKVSPGYPDYSYFLNGKDPIRQNKAKFQKSRLQTLTSKVLDMSLTERELTESLGYYRIYDCGRAKWQWLRDEHPDHSGT